MPRQLISRLAAIQVGTSSTSTEYFDHAFVLAYYGVDYPQNVKRLLTPIWLRLKNYQAYRDMYESFARRDDDQEPVFVVPGLTGRLYLRTHNAYLLKEMLSWRLDGGPAESLSYSLLTITRKDPVAVLAVGRKSSRASEAIVSVLVYAEQHEYKEITAKVARLENKMDRGLIAYWRKIKSDANRRRIYVRSH